MPEEGKKPQGPIKLTPDRAGQMLRAGDLTRAELPKAGFDELVEGLVTSERAAWNKFSGKDIEVPPPPQQLLDTLEKAKELGITAFEPHYLPERTFAESDKDPGWDIRPQHEYWDSIITGRTGLSMPFLGGDWVLIDSTPKPDYDQGQQQYPNDFLKDLLIKLYSPRINLPQGSRYRLSWNELHWTVFPEIVSLLGLKSEQVRLPRAIEFNILGNMYHPEWGDTDTHEWFEDRTNDNRAVTGGDSELGGLRHVVFGSAASEYDFVGFRPMIVFPSQ